MLQSSPPVAFGTAEDLDLPDVAAALQPPDEDLQSPEMDDQPFGTLQLRGTLGSDDLGLEFVGRLENAATPVILGPCRTAGSLFELLHCDIAESLLSSGLEQDGNVGGGPGGRSCRTVGCLGEWRAHCGG